MLTAERPVARQNTVAAVPRIRRRYRCRIRTNNDIECRVPDQTNRRASQRRIDLGCRKVLKKRNINRPVLQTCANLCRIVAVDVIRQFRYRRLQRDFSGVIRKIYAVNLTKTVSPNTVHRDIATLLNQLN